MTETSRHAWLSSQPLSGENVHQRCNLGARHRWGIEAGFLAAAKAGATDQRIRVGRVMLQGWILAGALACPIVNVVSFLKTLHP